MPYFSKFPRYFAKTENNNIIIADFFRRVSLGKKATTLSSILLPYLILDGETPEIVSNKFYASPFYHWVILSVNNIINPRIEWPIENDMLTPLVFDRYPFIVTVDNIEDVEINMTITTDEGPSFKVVDIKDETIYLKSAPEITYLAAGQSLYLPDMTEIHVVSVIDPLEGIHHYIDSRNGLFIDYDSSNPYIVPVSNFTFEEQENEKRRIIKILDPKYLAEFVRNFENIIGD